jgi:hypothetical protein
MFYQTANWIELIHSQVHDGDLVISVVLSVFISSFSYLINKFDSRMDNWLLIGYFQVLSTV